MRRLSLALFLLVGCAWLAVPVQAQTCDLADPEITINVNGSSYLIKYCGSNFDGTNTTFLYQVTEATGQDLSHWTLELCAGRDDIVSWSPTESDDGIGEVEIGPDPTTGVSGIKWNLEDDFDADGEDDGDSREFSVTLAGFYDETTVVAAVKTGSGENTGQTTGPSCELTGCVPGTEPEWDGNLTIDQSEHLARITIDTPNGFTGASVLAGSSNIALWDVEGVNPADLNKTNGLNGSVRNGYSNIAYTGASQLTQVTLVFTPLEAANSRFLFNIQDADGCELQVDPVLSAVLPQRYVLEENYPNPFNPSTSIGYDLPESATVKLQVFDVTGRLVQTLVDGVQEAGYHTATFAGDGLPSGIYFYHLEAGTYSATRRMVLLK